jgi:WD40 repeat protein
VNQIHVSPDGKELASAGQDRTLRLWNIGTADPPRVLHGHGAAVTGVRFSPAGLLVASGDARGALRLWVRATGQLSAVLTDHPAGIVALDFSRKGDWLAVTTSDGTVHGWDLQTRTKRALWRAPSGSPISFARFTPKGDLVSASATGKILLRSFRLTGHSAHRGHQGPVTAVSFSAGGQVASAGEDRTIRLWDLKSGSQQHVFLGHTEPALSVDLSFDGKLASGAADGTVRIWNLVSGAEERVLVGHTGRVLQVRFSSDGRLLASAGVDRSIRLWDLPERKVRRLAGHRAAVLDLALSPDDSLLASAGVDRSIRLWDLKSGRQTARLAGHRSRVTGLSFSPDGKQLLSGGDDGSVRLFRLDDRSSSILLEQAGHGVRVAWLKDGRLVVASRDRPARICRRDPVRCLFLDTDEGQVNALGVSHTGELLALARQDGSVRLFSAASARPRWFTAALLSEPPMQLTHGGLIPLDNKPVPMVKRWSRALREARDASRAGNRLCLWTAANELELWDLARDRLSWRRSLPALQQLLASPAGCVVLHRGEVTLHVRDGPRVLHREATAAAVAGETVLVAAGRDVHFFHRAGGTTGRRRVGVGVTALMLGEACGLVVGYGDGSLERFLPRGSGGPLARLPSLSTSPVRSLEVGPAGTLFAGFGDGSVRGWQLDEQRPLIQAKIHGPVTRLAWIGSILHAASLVGDHLALDLATLRQPYCQLMRELWRKVPVVWEGRVVLRPTPRGHSCWQPISR